MLGRWEPPDDRHRPALTRNAVIRWNFAVAKTLRHEGRFPELLDIFQKLSHEAADVEGLSWIHCRVLSHLADVMCELGQSMSALQLLYPQIERHKGLGNDSLAISLVPS